MKLTFDAHARKTLGMCCMALELILTLGDYGDAGEEVSIRLQSCRINLANQIDDEELFEPNFFVGE